MARSAAENTQRFEREIHSLHNATAPRKLVRNSADSAARVKDALAGLGSHYLDHEIALHVIPPRAFAVPIFRLISLRVLVSSFDFRGLT